MAMSEYRHGALELDDDHIQAIYQSAWETHPPPSLDGVLSALADENVDPIPDSFWAPITAASISERRELANQWGARRDAILESQQPAAAGPTTQSRSPYRRFLATVDPVPAYIFCHPVTDSLARDEQEVSHFVPFVGHGAREIDAETYFGRFGQTDIIYKDWNPDRILTLLETQKMLEDAALPNTTDLLSEDEPSSREPEAQREALRSRINDARILPFTLDEISRLSRQSDLLAATVEKRPKKLDTAMASGLLWCQHPGCMNFGCVSHLSEGPTLKDISYPRDPHLSWSSTLTSTKTSLLCSPTCSNSSAEVDEKEDHEMFNWRKWCDDEDIRLLRCMMPSNASATINLTSCQLYQSRLFGDRPCRDINHRMRVLTSKLEINLAHRKLLRIRYAMTSTKMPMKERHEIKQEKDEISPSQTRHVQPPSKPQYKPKKTKNINVDNVTNAIFCYHPGQACDAALHCPCYAEDQHCTRLCRCPNQHTRGEAPCSRRLLGCKCKSSARGVATCGDKQYCACARAERECLPELCGSCGAAETLASTAPMGAFNSTGEWVAGAVDPVTAHSKCANVVIQLAARAHPPVRVGASKVAGYGLFATEELRPSTFIYNYVGEIIIDAEQLKREDANCIIGRNYIFGLDKFDGVDGAYCGNLTRFINQAKGKHANAVAYSRWVDGDLRIGICTTKTVKKHGEVFLDYGETFDFDPRVH